VIVQTSRASRRILVRLGDGASIHEVLATLATEHAISAGQISATGIVEDVALATIDPVRRSLGDPRGLRGAMELLSLRGSLAREADTPVAQLFATLSRATDNGIELLGGRVAAARAIAVELVIDCLDELETVRPAERPLSSPPVAAPVPPPTTTSVVPPQTTAVPPPSNMAPTPPVRVITTESVPSPPVRAERTARSATMAPGAGSVRTPIVETVTRRAPDPSRVREVVRPSEPAPAPIVARPFEPVPAPIVVPEPEPTPVSDSVPPSAMVDEDEAASPSPDELRTLLEMARVHEAMPAAPERSAPGVEPEPGDLLDHPTFGVVEIEAEGDSGRVRIRLSNGSRREIALEVFEVVPRDPRGEQRLFALRPRRR
jgi:predicted DNA-binding protein with PD1-like motif